MLLLTLEKITILSSRPSFWRKQQPSPDRVQAPDQRLVSVSLFSLICLFVLLACFRVEYRGGE